RVVSIGVARAAYAALIEWSVSVGKLCDLLFIFFFSSRRRHTRLVSDWSSDVCSSDLRSTSARLTARSPPQRAQARAQAPALEERSEERRVGKECRSRWWPDH